jgi:hypothetical protein
MVEADSIRRDHYLNNHAAPSPVYSSLPSERDLKRSRLQDEDSLPGFSSIQGHGIELVKTRSSICQTSIPCMTRRCKPSGNGKSHTYLNTFDADKVVVSHAFVSVGAPEDSVFPSGFVHHIELKVLKSGSAIGCFLLAPHTYSST